MHLLDTLLAALKRELPGITDQFGQLANAGQRRVIDAIQAMPIREMMEKLRGR